MNTATKFDQIYSPTANDVDMAKNVAPVISRILGRHRADPHFDERIQFRDDVGEQVILPAGALELLKNIMIQMAQGNAITLVPIHAELTTQQAADMLNVSRPHLVKLLESGQMGFTKKGTHRRVLFSEVQSYKAQIDAKRMEALDALSAQAQELDMGY